MSKKAKLVILLALCLTFALAACASDEGNAGTDTPAQSDNAGGAPAASNDDSGDAGDVLGGGVQELAVVVGGDGLCFGGVLPEDCHEGRAHGEIVQVKGNRQTQDIHRAGIAVLLNDDVTVWGFRHVIRWSVQATRASRSIQVHGRDFHRRLILRRRFRQDRRRARVHVRKRVRRRRWVRFWNGVRIKSWVRFGFGFWFRIRNRIRVRVRFGSRVSLRRRRRIVRGAFFRRFNIFRILRFFRQGGDSQDKKKQEGQEQGKELFQNSSCLRSLEILGLRVLLERVDSPPEPPKLKMKRITRMERPQRATAIQN